MRCRPKTGWVCLVGWCILISAQATYSKETYLRVRIQTLPANMNIRGLGLEFQADKNPYKKVSLNKMRSYDVRFSENSWIIQGEDSSKKLKGPHLALEADLLEINSQVIPRKVFLWPRDSQNVDVIAVLSLDEYLEGVVPHEMPAVWPMEALKAQSIVARSFALKKLKERQNNPFHLDSTIIDQVYRFPSDLSKDQFQRVKDAIRSTHDLVLKNTNNQVVRALYHADCGGQTEKSSRVWGREEIEFSVQDPFCKNNPYKNWVVKLHSKKIEDLFNLDFKVESIQVKNRDESGRAETIAFLSENNQQEISAQDFRKKIGFKKIKSTRLDILKDQNVFKINGSGFGHGVGMCQWGARHWALSGKNYQEILKHYFPRFSVQSL